jgi:TolB-like protein/class 3 adenylate cyclase/tetratricopeptide (TPR) repeat protein
MAEERLQRRLAAILSADVVGYSRLMGLDEAGTLSRLNSLRRDLIDPTIAAHSGRIVKLVGDGALVEFASAVDAVTCAVEIQRQLREHARSEADPIQFRIGVNVGDIIVEGDDIVGDGVNIAARIESIAEPGGISISEDAWRQVQGKVSANFVDSGEQSLRNIKRPVRVYRVDLEQEVASGFEVSRPALALPDKPSIAVLAFTNMSRDPEQEYFSDGISEDIITELSKLPELHVTARNSTFIYKDKPVDVKRVGRELGVRYVLEGSVRKAANRVRVTGQLIDTVTGVHLWAERFDGQLNDVFDLQDEVTSKVVAALVPKIERAEMEHAKRKPTESLTAYDCYIRGKANFYRSSRRSIAEALALFERAFQLDSEFASAYAMAAWCYLIRNNNRWLVDPEKETERMVWLAKQAVRVGHDDPLALSVSGLVHSQVPNDLTTCATLLDRAVALAPNLAIAWNFSGWIRIYLGEAEVAIDHLERAIRLDPLNPFLYNSHNAVAAAYFLAGRYEIAAQWAEKALHELPRYLPAIRIAAASYALSGQIDRAQTYVRQMLEIDPSLRASNLKGIVPFRQMTDASRYVDGLRKAGLPE